MGSLYFERMLDVSFTGVCAAIDTEVAGWRAVMEMVELGLIQP